MRFQQQKRSGTDMDRVTLLTPPQLAGLRGVRGLRKLRGNARAPMKGLFDFDFSMGEGDYYDPAALVAEPSTNDSFDWQGLLTQAPTVIKDLMLASSTAEYQSKLMEINLQRARQGLRPIDASQYAPQMNVGLAPSTQNTIAGLSVGTLVLAAGAAFLLTRNKRR